MNKERIENIINKCLSTGADFAEVFYEDTIKKKYILVDSKIKDIKVNKLRGVGIRVALGNDVVYGSTNKLDDKSIDDLVLSLISRFNDDVKYKDIVLTEEEVNDINKCNSFDMWSEEEKVNYLKRIDSIAREESLISQVQAMFLESDRFITIGNSLGKLVSNTTRKLRLYSTFYVEREDDKASVNLSRGASSTYELFDNYDIEKAVRDSVAKAILKLDAKNFKGGELPAILGPGFGAVIFHEACGHGLEATSVAIGESVFCDKLNTRIGSDKVTLIDDGTITNTWGSNSIDDEGNVTKKNILIENGILKNYLIDDLNNRKMNLTSNGCSRRENYSYMPTSRMSNTYLAPGNDSIRDMIKSIDLGVYCTDMGGGSVNPITGDFNFAVDDAYLIEDGKITTHIKGISLIGNSRDILMNVEMVSDDLDLACGDCGSLSGSVPVTIGQPTIKVSKILVGGRE